MSNKKTLILIDGHALAFRQFFALERTAMKTSDNQPTWAVYGFFKAVFDLLLKRKPDYIAVAFDVGRQTFRVSEAGFGKIPGHENVSERELKWDIMSLPSKEEMRLWRHSVPESVLISFLSWTVVRMGRF